MYKAKKAVKIAREARVAVERWRAYFKYNIDQYHEIQEFVLGRQWTDEEEDMLKTFKKVPLQFNKLATLTNTLLGEQQQNTPQIAVEPLSNCEEETANIRQIVVKDTMLSTDAKTVYQVAAHQAITGGFGCFIVDTEYTHDKSFEQDIVYRALKDATKGYWDIGAEEISKIDGMFSGYISQMTRKKFRQVYGKDLEEKVGKIHGISQTEEEIALAVQPNTTEDPFNWADADSITIIDHYVRKYVPDTLYRLSNGSIVNQEELDEIIEASAEIEEELKIKLQEEEFAIGKLQGADPSNPADMPLEQVAEQDIAQEDEIDLEQDDGMVTLYDENGPIRIEEQRPSKRSKIIHYKIAGDYILDKSEFPAEDLPIVFMDQHSYYDKYGKQVCRPFVIDAIDAQRYLNYLGTQSAFILKISRYDQFIGSKKNVQSIDTQRNWRDPNAVQGMLAYDESPSGAKPEQLRPPELSASLGQQYERAINDMYTSTGMFPTRMGQNGNEISGAAIDARTRQGSYATYVAFNSINRAISAGGTIVNQMIPRVYDTQRIMNLMTPDKGRQNITINESQDEYGMKIKNDLRKGSFKVMLQAGPSYEGQKAQALESLNMALQANPQLFNLIADLYADNLPLMNTIEIKNRLKTIVPPEILEAGKTGEMPKEAQKPNPQDQAIMAEIQNKQQKLELDKQKLQMQMQESQAKNEMAMMKLKMDQLDAMAELEGQKLRYMAETERTASDNAISHADNITKLIMSTMKKEG